MTEHMNREVFERHAQHAAEQFRARYGLTADQVWTDDLLERALADHGYPPLQDLPGEARGMMVGVALPNDTPDAWRRVNASHLLGHAILHGGGRCGGCADWGS